jgi:hypothetical protein
MQMAYHSLLLFIEPNDNYVDGDGCLAEIMISIFPVEAFVIC